MNISILGCGWLGFPLAVQLTHHKHQVKGSTTTPDKMKRLRQEKILPYLLKLTPELENPHEVQSFWDSDTLVLNVPPGRGRDNMVDYHLRQIQSVASYAAQSSINFVLFVSSTSVYPKFPGVVTEKDVVPGKAARSSGNALIQAEQLLQEQENFATTILRLGGLYGGDRHPARYLAGRKNLGDPAAPVNLIHRDDCLQIIQQIIEENITGEVFNAVADSHPARRQYYTRTAKALGLEPPTFSDENEDKNYKIVSNQKLRQRLSYSFSHADLMASWPL
ncbi:MAG TPA: SDR family oxidoreductase [Balneolaceae bacterium]|nr:SDR family oxidoreductase [Balneolaceae bacterium]